ncbi:TonB-dependent receptor [uncultured Parabacteroides sp.]|uniref:TonB-dependent receptor n=1 Tax=uncultured Parabacteroides sp. TaxID=512312 RepID=UPI0025FF7F5E|nr:TonB-dependent receptor [uncultured Parabacteroides sp.]
MKLSVFLLVCSIGLAQATGSYAQKATVNLEIRNQTVKEVLDEIEQQSDFSFFFNIKHVDLNRKVSVVAKKSDIFKVLETVFAGTDVRYSVVDRKIILSTEKQEIQQSDKEKRVTGVVYDQNGLPVIGANVIEKGTTNGVITDIDGKFSLTVSDKAIIQISYIGYIGQDVTVGNRSDLTIALKEDSQALDEVVVVGYGVQKKVNVVGSISQVNSEVLENRPTPQLSNALTGQMPGVTVIQRSGRPGDSNGEIRVRGVGSFGAEPSALVLIDGIPGNMNNINMQDVESVSVLKDASTAAIYGARAANGVILITTKNGKEGKTTVNYNGYVGFNTPTALPEFVDTWRWAELYNEATNSPIYSPEEIMKFKDGSDPDRYGNANYLEEVLSRKGLQTGHDISINGGNDKTKYVVSFGYLSQNGLVDKNNYSRYNARINLTNQLLPNLKLTTRASGVYGLRKEPSVPGGNPAASDMLSTVQMAFRFPGLTPSVLSDGSYAVGPEMTGTPTSWVRSASFFENPYFSVNTNVRLDYSPIKDLQLSLIGGFNKTFDDTKTYRSTLKLSDGRETSPSSLVEKNTRTTYKTFQATADYNKEINRHAISVLAGYSWEQEDYTDLEGSRDKFPGNDLPYLNAGSPDNQKALGGGYGWAIQSYFGRLKYNYAERYLFESTFRYDGSSRFPANQKYGFFPSVAAGWRISEESFMKENERLEWLSGLKLKASWGRLGNQNISNYPYQTVYQLGENYSYGGSVFQGAAVVKATDPTIKWEETETVDIGLESILWNGLLSFNASWFNRNTYDILYKPAGSVSSILGLEISEMNTGKLRNKGWEFEIGHKNTIGEFSYSLNGNLSIINNKVVSLGVGNVEQLNGMVGNGDDLFIGHPMQLYYGYKTDGVFMNQEDINGWVDQTSVNANPEPGDIRYVDISGPDGVPDGKVDPNYDRVPLGSRIPKYTFGLNINMEYKKFDLSVLLQGVAGVKGFLSGDAGYALRNKGNIQTWQADGRFDPNNPTQYPEYPRLQDILGNSTPPNYQLSDFWTLNASYIRLKNIQLGYTFPKQWIEKLKMSHLRVYVQSENPFSINSYRKGWDPEINTSGDYYPILATYTLGINLKF